LVRSQDQKRSGVASRNVFSQFEKLRNTNLMTSLSKTFLAAGLLSLLEGASALQAASLLGQVGTTTTSGTVSEGVRTPINLYPGEDIYGPFEAGFGQQQDFVLAQMGCTTGKGYIQGGVDTELAERVVAKDCNVQLPRTENGLRISLLDSCGGHTREYHFHERLKCLYEEKGTHSTQVGQTTGGQPIYGKWENFETGELPLLDACGGHWGFTPESPDKEVYHYHVQDRAPFTVGCVGPAPDGGLVTVQQCRSLYRGCGDGDQTVFATHQGNVAYDPWCPCYDADGSNVGTKELPVFSATNVTLKGNPVTATTSVFGGLQNGGSTSSKKGGSTATSKFGGKSKQSKFGQKLGQKFGQKVVTAAPSAAPTTTPTSAPLSASSCSVKTDQDAQLCTAYASHCDAGQRYNTWMLQNCDRTCCIRKAAHASSGCGSKSDRNPHLCRAYASHCQVGQKYHAWMTLNCEETCCQSDSPPPVPAQLNCASLSDSAPAAMCSTYKTHCQDGQRYYAWMQANCANTCCLSSL